MSRLALRAIGLGVLAAAFAALWGCEAIPVTGDEGSAQQAGHSDVNATWPGEAVARPAAPVREEGCSLAFPTGDRATSALLLTMEMPGSVRLNQPYDMRIVVDNLTSGQLQNVVVNLENTDNLSVVSSDPRQAQVSGGGSQWVLGDLGPNETRTIRVSAQASREGVSSSCLSASYNNVLCCATRVVQPTLALVKTATDMVLVCDEITLRYEVKNSGTGPAENVRVQDTLPQGLTTVDGKSTVDVAVGTLSAGEAKAITVRAKAARTGRFGSAASAIAAGNLSAKSAEVSTDVRQPVLTLDVTCPKIMFIGRDLKYEFTVKNTGNAASDDTVLTASVPAGAAFASATDGGTASRTGVSWRLGTVAAGASKTVSFVVRPGAAGSFATSGSVSGECANRVNANCATDVTGIPAILLEVVDNDDPIEVGQQVTYVIRVTNQGSAEDTNIRIVCELPAEQSFVSAGGATNGTVSGKTITFAPLPRLAAKERVEWRVVVRADGTGDVRFGTNMTSDQLTSPVRETEATRLYR